MLRSNCYKILGVIVFLLVLISLPLLAACGEPTPAPAPSPAPAPAPSPAPAPAPTPAPPPSEEVVTWVFASDPGTAANTMMFHPYPRFQNAIEEATGGRLTFDTKISMFKPTDIVHAIADGRVDAGYQRFPFVSGTFPLWDIASFPFFYENNFEYEKALKDPRLDQLIQESAAEAGLYKLCEALSHGQGVFSNKPLEVIADFNGLKTRASGMLQTFALQKLGAAPLTMATTEISEAVQRGTVDAVATGSSFGLSLGMTDVADYYCLWRVTSGYSGGVMVNLDSWNALPADLQQIVKETALDLQAETVYGAHILELEAFKGVKAAGLTFIVPEAAEIAKARELTKPAFDQWLAVAGPSGPEILAICSQYASGAAQ